MHRISGTATALVGPSLALALTVLPGAVGAQAPTRPEILWSHDTEG